MENNLENFSKNVLDKLEHLKCPICLDIVENVRELPCRHIFCFKCLETYKKGNDGLICPLCKKEISKRKFLSHDAALDSLCRFVKTLCDDFKVHHNTDIKTFFRNINMKTVSDNEAKTTNQSDEIIPQSSDENIIPCTSKPKDQRKSLKRNGPKLNTKNTPKPIKLDIKRHSASEEKKSKPKIGLSRNKNKIGGSTSNNFSQLQPKGIPQYKQYSDQLWSEKNKILQWLHDTRNKFERISQTQSFATQNNTLQDVDMPSISQICVRKSKEMSGTTKENQWKSEKSKETSDRRALSVENLCQNKCKQLRRHSLECTSPVKTKKYQNLQEMNYLENQLIINLIEDEVLDVIDKEISGENCRKKSSLSPGRKENIVKNPGVMNAEEDTFLDQLDNEMMQTSSECKKNSKTNFNITENDLENKSKSSWKSIRKFRKSIGKTKIPKKLDISLQSTQKSNKKDMEIKLNTSDPSKSTRSSVMETKIVDFQKMEEYFSKAIPKMMATNSKETSSQEIISDEEIYPIDKANKETDNDNNSDIYIYQTQPLSKVKSEPISDKISYATKLTNKLENIVLQLIQVDKIETKQLTPLLPSIKNIFEILNKFDNIKIHSLPVEKISCSEKQIQTDLLSLDVFPITPNHAFKSINHEDVTTQTENFCTDCPHFCPENGYKNLSDEASSPIMKSNQTDENGKTYKSKLRALNESTIKLDQELLVSKLQTEKIDTKINEVEELNPESLKEQNTSNIDVEENMNRTILDSQIAVEHILKKCSTQYNTLNISKTDDNSISKSNSNVNEIQLNSRTPLNFEASQGSAIMCSVPQTNSRVNRKLMFEKVMKERIELEQSLKRVRSENSMSNSDEERPCKVKCNRFLQHDISIEFESESLNDNCQYLKNSDVEMKETNDAFPARKNDLVSSQRTKSENEKTYKKTQHSQADTLLNYCDELIERANRQISVKPATSNLEDDMNLSQILSESNKDIKTNANPNLSVLMHPLEKPREVNNKMKTQELLKHYDELIEKANKQIEIENVDPNEHDNMIRLNYSQIPTTSKDIEVPEEVPEIKSVIKTQDLLDHCNALIAKTTKEIARNEYSSLPNEEEKNKILSQNDDEFFCQNLDRLDSVLEKENKNDGFSGDKLSESLFASCKDNVINKSLANNKEMFREESRLGTPKRQRSVEEEINIDEFKNSPSKKKKEGGFNSSDDEIFSDVDVVETTPQKSVCFFERLSCSQAVNQNSRGSLKIQENVEDFPASMLIVPPPPGFDDVHEKIDSEQIIACSEKESENVIPTSLSPQRFEIPSIRKPLGAANMNHKNFAKPQGLPTLSQQFMKVSPICKEKSKNLNVMEIVRQSKFSPLTILPRSNTSVLTSTPKQKSILSYVKPKLKSSQEASTSTHERSKPCIAFTRLSNAETLCVISLCNKDLASRQDKFGPCVTHMIVSVDKHNYVKDHTIKFISAIAAGIWVLNIKWVQECLAKNQIVDEEPFEVLDITGIPSPRISRLTHLTNPLLKGFKFFIPRSFTQTSAEDVKNIIQLLQGVVVSSIEEFKEEKECVCIIISELVDTEDYTQYEKWLMSYKIITVDINWLSLSVSRYKILSLRPHLLCSDDSIEELGYPSHLVVDVAPSLTQDVTYD